MFMLIHTGRDNHIDGGKITSNIATQEKVCSLIYSLHDTTKRKKKFHLVIKKK